MGLAEIFILAVGLAMDAFAVAVCKGLSINKINFKIPLIVGLWFGAFQALMPLIGYFLGVQFSDKIAAVDHWIAFILLGLIGANMLKEAFSKEEDKADASLSPMAMLPLAVATSIDALAVGVTLAFLNVNVTIAVACIGIVTFIISALGVKIGNVFGAKYKSKAEITGGVILIILGIKILAEHLL